MQFFGLMLLMAFISSCGKSNSNAGVPIDKVLPLNGSNIEGVYMAQFDTLNSHVAGTIPGSATLQRRDDKFYAYVRLFGGAPHAWHQQNIHEGRCPVPGDDVNADGFIDAEEARNVLGPILIPLDSNLSSQSAGKNVYPIADSSGSYFYERTTSFEKMFADLKSADTNLEDNYVKLDPNSGLDFAGKVVVIHGAPSTAVYPETVATMGTRPAYQTLPIACGTFEQVTSIPGEAVPEEAPGPVGDPQPQPQPQPEVSTPDSPDTYPVPQPETTEPRPRPRPRPETTESDEDEDRWYDRIIDWWRHTWERERGGRGQTWGNG